MKNTLAYFSTFLHKDFLIYTTERLQDLTLSFGSLPFIIYVGKHPGCTPTELTSALRMDWGHTQRTTTRLVDEGFMTREKVGRTHQLTLTESGLRAFNISHQVFFSWDRQALEELTAEEQAQLLELLNKVVRHSKGKHCL